MFKQPKEKKCVICEVSFMPNKTTVRVCSLDCAIVFAKNKVEKQEHKEWNKRKKDIKAKLETEGSLKQLLQRHINILVRQIDKNCCCVSSGRSYGQMQSGHFWTTQSQPSIRFHLFNIWIQSAHDNNHKSGNITEYRKAIIKYFGQHIMDYIDDLPRLFPVLKLTKEEIKEKTEIVKECIKEAKLLTKLSSKERIEKRIYFNNRINIYK